MNGKGLLLVKFADYQLQANGFHSIMYKLIELKELFFIKLNIL